MKDENATVIVSLEGPPEEILKRLHKDARWGIKKAREENLLVEQAKGDSDWQDYYKIYLQTINLGGATPETLENLKQNSKILFLCKKDGKTIAGASIRFTSEYDSKIPRLFTNASLREYLPLQPNNLLYWHCILWSKEHLQGINKFKEKWGKVVYYTRKYPLYKVLGRKLIRNSEFFWKLNKRLKERS
jgi:hypothetical protein